jgi:hypothetical protein
MFDYEGSRSEFLKLLAQCGEEPAFIERARAPQVALDALLLSCKAKHEEMLKWPAHHLSVLAHQVGKDWSKLGYLLAAPESVAMLEALHATIPASTPVQNNWFASDKAALRQFLESAERFNRHWRAYVDGLDWEPVNKPRRDYNQYYQLEKACAFGSEAVTDGFVPVAMIDGSILYERFPLLVVPSMA